MSQRLCEEYDKLLEFHTYAFSLQDTITCPLKLAILISQPGMFDVPENTEGHITVEEFCGNAMENKLEGSSIKVVSKWCNLSFHFSRKFLKFLPIVRDNHWSHHVPLLNLWNQHAEEMRREAHCLLAWSFQKASYSLWYQRGTEKQGRIEAETVIIEDSILPSIFLSWW